MTKDEFVTGYCERSQITRQQYDAWYVALACECGDESCRGWATIENNEASISNHMRVSAPESAYNEWALTLKHLRGYSGIHSVRKMGLAVAALG